MNPSIHIDLIKYQNNLVYLNNLIKSQDMTCMAVSKVFCADQKLIDIINTTDIKYIGDSRIKNFVNMKTTKEKVLLRIFLVKVTNFNLILTL